MILQYLDRRSKLLQVAIIILSTAQIGFNAQIPEIMDQLTNQIMHGDPESKVTQLRERMYLCAQAAFAVSIAIGFASAKFSSDVTCSMRSRFNRKVQQMQVHDLERLSVQSLSTRITSDVQRIQEFLAGMQMVGFTFPLTAVVVFPAMMMKSWLWTVYMLVIMAVGQLIVVVVMHFLVPYIHKRQKLNDELNRKTFEYLDGLPIVRQFGSTKDHESAFGQISGLQYKTDLRIRTHMAFIGPMVGQMTTVVPTLIYLSAFLHMEGAGADSQQLLFSDMVSFQMYALMLLTSLAASMSMMGVEYPQYVVARERVKEVLEFEPSVSYGDRTNPVHEGKVEFRNVSFAYPGFETPALDDASFTIEGGSWVAVVGTTAAGKTTAVELMMKSYDVTSGEILIDGMNVNEYDYDDLHGRMSYATQTPDVFSASVRDNILFGSRQEGLSDEELGSVLDDCACTEFVSGLPNGLDTVIDEKGRNLSGGQKQRISIARAVASKADIYIFDDSFSALDASTDAEVRKALARRLRGSTVIMITQKISSVRGADKIIVLDCGSVVGCGTHDELMETCEHYADLVHVQSDGGSVR